MRCAALWAVVLAGCLGPAEHRCADDTACGGGTCVSATGFCAFPSDRCCGALVYGSGAGPLANTCVLEASDCVDGGTAVDAAVDAVPIDGPPPMVAHLTEADSYLGTGDWLIAEDQALDTTMSGPGGLPPGVTATVARATPGGAEVIVIHARSVILSADVTLQVTGTRPLIVIADRIDIAGRLDVSADRERPGPGGSPGSMGLGRGGDGETNAPNGGGGGGGGYGQPGGRGGSDGGTPAVEGGVPGVSWGDAQLTVLAGGSGGGGAAQTSECGNPGAPGGGGGGALQLTAVTSIAVTGVIDAGGGGGPPGRQCASGAEAGRGGGAGGAIYLQAPQVSIAGAVAANGGGGGAATSLAAGQGTAGADGTVTTMGAAGGTLGGMPCGGGGGSSGQPAGAGRGLSTYDGCGGGGGVGRIVVRGDLAQLGVVSPNPVAVMP
jgi:hypothetical protein